MGYGDHWRSSLAPVLRAVHSWTMLSPGTTNGNIFPSCPWILFLKNAAWGWVHGAICSSPGCCPWLFLVHCVEKGLSFLPTFYILKTHTRKRVTLSILTFLPAFLSLYPLALTAFSQPENKLKDVSGFFFKLPVKVLHSFADSGKVSGANSHQQQQREGGAGRVEKQSLS